MKRLIPLLLLITVSHIWPQQFEVHRFGIKEGLNIELTKALCQDDLGFIWVATDVGLSRSDGYSFTSYTSPSGIAFGKSLIKRRNGNLLLAADLGLFEIIPSLDTATIKTLIPGTRQLTDKKVWFPKSVFEAADGTILLSEQGSIVRFRNGNLKRFFLPKEENSFNFLRAHHFFELDNGELIVVSHNGGLYRYDTKSDQLEKFALLINQKNITAVKYLGNGRFLTGNNRGVYSITLGVGKDGKPTVSDTKHLVKDLSVSAFEKSDELAFATTWDNGLFSFRYGDNDPAVTLYTEPGRIKFNDILRGRNSELWLSSESGIILLTRRHFQEVLPEVIKHYVQDIVTIKDDLTYVSDGNTLYKVLPTEKGYRHEVIMQSPDNVILTIARFRDGILASLSDGELVHVSDNGITTRSTPDLKGKFIKYISYGNSDDLWMIEEAAKEILNFRSDGTIIRYDVSFSGIESFSTIFMNNKGELFVGGTSSGIELLKFTHASGKFTTFIPASNLPKGRLVTVNDMDFTREGIPVLATSVGVFVIKGQRAELLENSLSMVNARSLSVDDRNDNVWIGTENGLYGYDGQGISHYDVVSGLPSKTIGTRTITIDDDGVLWVGTAEGVAIMKNQYRAEPSSSPLLLVLNRKLGLSLIPGKDPLEITEDNNWQLNIFDFHFPVRSTIIMYRFGDEMEWQTLRSGNVLSLADLPTGSTTVHVRIKPLGQSQWSRIATLELTINPVWYRRWWAYMIYLGTLMVVIYSSSRLYAAKLRKENLQLETLVAERTTEIKARNEELTISRQEIEEKNAALVELLNELKELNATKDKMFSIISHDLKNPFSTIMGFSRLLVEEMNTMTIEEIVDFISRIDDTARNTYNLLENLLAWSRSQSGRLSVNPSPLPLDEVIEGNKRFVKDLAFQKKITVSGDAPAGCLVMADNYALDLILRNLLTNAIKFSFPGSEINIAVTNTGNEVAISIIDHGTGMNKESIDKLFRSDVFHSTHGTNHERGTGLGLILVKELIEKQNGTISVTSKPAEGSTFTFTLPAAK